MSGRSRFDASPLFLSVHGFPVGGSSGGCVLVISAHSACAHAWMRIVQPSLSSQTPVGSAKAGAMLVHARRKAAQNRFSMERYSSRADHRRNNSHGLTLT